MGRGVVGAVSRSSTSLSEDSSRHVHHSILKQLLCSCRYEKIEEAKKEMRKKAELQKRFEKNGDAGAESDDSDVEDEDKIAEQEEAGGET